MEISDAQRDMARAHVSGGPGVIVSGCVWAVAAIVYQLHGIGPGFAALFFGGMLIFPLSKLIVRFAFGRANEQAGNPLAATALESTVVMIGGLIAAWLFLPLKPALVFPVAAIAVGTRYGLFKTIYGDRSFWALGAVITAIGAVDIFVAQRGVITPALVAAMELAFGVVLTMQARRV